jgi:hypothetical protein
MQVRSVAKVSHDLDLITAARQEIDFGRHFFGRWRRPARGRYAPPRRGDPLRKSVARVGGEIVRRVENNQRQNQTKHKSFLSPLEWLC